jgi:hypothetical protein
VWDTRVKGFTNPDTATPMPTWNEACAELAEPAHVVHFGAQVHVKGILGGTEEAGRHVGYLTILWNQICQVVGCLPWLTWTIGRSVAVGETPIWRGVGPAGVGTSVRWPRRASREA